MEATTITWNLTRGTCKKDQSYSIDLPAWPIVWGATTVLVAAAETGILFVINGGTWRDQFDIVILFLVWPLQNGAGSPGWKSMESRFHCLGICLSAVPSLKKMKQRWSWGESKAKKAGKTK